MDAEDMLAARATAIGEAWAHETVRVLREQERGIIGAWPGTMREARRRVLAGVTGQQIEASRLDELARVANTAARRGWQEVAEPDPEL